MKTGNPFISESDRWHIWDMLVARDIKAFVDENWDMVADDFIEEGFMGIDAGKHGNPDAWNLSYPNLKAYQKEWLRQARIFNSTDWAEDGEAALFRVTRLRDIDIQGNAALVHKKFFGLLVKSDGQQVPTNWQTLYRCRKLPEGWKIVGFTGYMPHYLGEAHKDAVPKRIPEGSTQHITAGPYSPVLEVNPQKLVVISGQAAINKEGVVVGQTIEEQSALTLENCKQQLSSAGCTMDDVFKVNVYLKDLADWPAFNEVYKGYFSEPLPVRTAVGSGLLMTLLVEIEMWATKS